MADSQNHWARYDLWDERHLSLDRFAVEDPENGFCASASPYDPKPSLIVENGQSCRIPKENMKIIEKFKRLGVIKKFETY